VKYINIGWNEPIRRQLFFFSPMFVCEHREIICLYAISSVEFVDCRTSKLSFLKKQIWFISNVNNNFISLTLWQNTVLPHTVFTVLPQYIIATIQYILRPQPHSFILPKTSALRSNNFLHRMLYKDSECCIKTAY